MINYINEEKIMSMINGKEYLNAKDKNALSEELDEELDEELEWLHMDLEGDCRWVEEVYPVLSTFTYLGMEMCVTSYDCQDPRHVRALITSSGAHNVEGEIIINCEYLNSVTGLFMSKSFNIYQLREIYQLNSSFDSKEYQSVLERNILKLNSAFINDQMNRS